MTLSEFVLAYDGDVLFDARESKIIRDSASECPIVSFDRNEREAIKAEILERPVEKYRAEVSISSNAITGRTYSITMVALLGDKPAKDSDTEPVTG
jgi:hypothetical protein